MATNAVTGATAANTTDATAPGSVSGIRGVRSAGTTGNNSDVDAEVQSNKPLFLNFTAELAPFNAAKRQKRKSNVYKVSGVNILNRNSVDSKTALERLQRRRENHNFVERRRRDNINHTITTLSTLIPYCTDDSVKLNKGNILHMAVEYIRDLQDINAALSEENVRLGGSVSTTLPEALRQQRLQQQQQQQGSSANSGIDTMPHSHDEDEMDDDSYSHTSPVLSSAATSPRFVPTNNKNTNSTSLASSRASSSSALSSAGGSTKNGGSAKREDGAAKKGKKRSNSSVAGNSSSSGSKNDVAVASCERRVLLSSSSGTAAPTAVPSANMSPIALGASQVPTSQTPSSANSNISMASPLSGASSQQHRHLFHSSHNPQKNASLGSPGSMATVASTGHLMPPLQMSSAQSVPHSPVHSGLTRSYDSSNTASGAQTPLPPIGSIAPGGRMLASGIANASLATHQHKQQQHHQHQHMSDMHKSLAVPGSNGASTGSGRLPTQSMPSSPTLKSFRTYAGNGGSVSNTGTGYSSRQTHGSFNTHPFFNSDVSSIRHHIQQQTQSPYRQQPSQQQQQRVYPGAQSLQNTPLIRPSRDSVFGDGFELPPIHSSSESANLPKQSQQPKLQQ
ncbi:hypothetical protein IW140_003398 [Coemansia sp. RSA 1813]|nr:hypothetical protein EV178_003216 [Coemansia sp. RSA 1646]KAJ1771023.1 hypothetical protein LPJ74_002714 [Coemansia sp. RSA 1843]KAJ2089262.1 hypothetical protein IW138_003582 [Coemansia sp. RSA 986]KAJ2215092.1 hypothetical protein EV179_002460 [Coemansia sp. RSA 487]KAJ2569033.1 hypothetical protein IW140_003398 [Coemansia sp. RSA 1813]